MPELLPAPTCLRTDASSGLVYLNNRYHDPSLGAFISVDPLVTMTGEPYTYASGNPITFSDPTGLYSCSYSYIAELGCYQSPGGQTRPPQLPEWVPDDVRPEAIADDGLRADIRFLDEVLTMSLDDFADLWENADQYPDWNWTNDGCSDNGAVTGGHFGCIRHDFVYRNTRLIDFDNDLGGELVGNAGALKGAADRQLAKDVDGLISGLLTWGGVAAGGGGFFEPLDSDARRRWRSETAASPYGTNENVRTPSDSNLPLAGWGNSMFDWAMWPNKPATETLDFFGDWLLL